MSGLKPCPFCGSEDIYETYSQEYALGTKNPEIFCNSCKAIFFIEDDSPYVNCDEDYAYRKAKTKEAWNRRAKDEGKSISRDHENDLISRRAAIDALYIPDYENGEAYSQYVDDKRAIELVPPAQPEIIHCRNCKWHNGEINQCNAQICASMEPDDFCSRAERREDG